MAPPEHTFPVSELEQRVHSVTKNFKEKSRKLPKDFDLKRDCELFELVQYSCTTDKQLRDQTLENPTSQRGIECFPFVRLFRRCGQGADMFHVETTAWEGQYAWKPKRVLEEDVNSTPKEAQSQPSPEEGKWFWSKK